MNSVFTVWFSLRLIFKGFNNQLASLMDKEAGGTRARRSKLLWTDTEENQEEETLMNCKPWLLQNRLVLDASGATVLSEHFHIKRGKKRVNKSRCERKEGHLDNWKSANYTVRRKNGHISGEPFNSPCVGWHGLRWVKQRCCSWLHVWMYVTCIHLQIEKCKVSARYCLVQDKK